MPFQSPYPEVPPFPDRNVTYLFNNPEEPSENDHVLHVDGLTGEERTKNQFFERVYDGATALAAHPSKGGLGLGPSDMVGILSHNCLVSASRDIHHAKHVFRRVYSQFRTTLL